MAGRERGAMKSRCVMVLLLLGLLAARAAAEGFDPLRGFVPVPDAAAPPRMAQPEDTDVRRARSYPMQPPTIPHRIDGYQVDLNAHKCLTCHGRRRTEISQAPMVSVTHYMDRDGNFLAEVSPRRYFCNQCHVVRHAVRPPVGSRFEDVGALLRRRASGG